MTVENQTEYMLEAARMYYCEDMTQAEIAKKLYLSRTKVSRLLKTARESGMVEIVINGKNRRNTFLEQLLQNRFGLKQAIVFADFPQNEEQAFRKLAQNTADYIDTILKKDSIVGIARGNMMNAVVDCMKPQKQLPIRVVQLIGLMNNPSQNEEEMELVQKFAKAYGGTYHNLFAPFVLSDENVRKVLNQVAAVGKTIELAGRANVILTSLGRADLRDKHILWNSYLTKEEKESLAQKHPVGLFCGRYYDINGKLIDTELHEQIFGLKVKEIVSRQQVIGVSLGREKVLPILGALHGHLIKTLITDERTALNVLIAEGTYM